MRFRLIFLYFKKIVFNLICTYLLVLKFQMHFDPDLISIQFSYLLLENSRIYCRNKNESNFHVLHSIISAADLQKELNLNITGNYVASLSTTLVFIKIFNIVIYSFNFIFSTYRAFMCQTSL